MRARPPARTARVLCAALLLAAGGCREAELPHQLRLAGEALGTGWAVAVVTPGPPEEAWVADVEGRIVATLDRVDRGMSTWRDDAELARFNQETSRERTLFSPETRRVIEAALDLARETGGAFDPTVAPLVALWGFGARAATTEPTEEELAGAVVGWRQLAWDEEHRLVRRTPGVQLDLSAIAKGYAVDAVVAELARDLPRGILVELGGEVRAVGANANGDPWRIGIEDPGEPGFRFEEVVTLTGAALATSGDYRQARRVGGKWRTHVVDPRTRYPVTTGVTSASVVAPTCMEADAVATALMVLGPDEGLAWVEARPWLEALLLVRDDAGVLERRASSGWGRWAIREP